MSEDENTETSVLLPSASVAVFTGDKETAEVVRSIGEDWRFARVRLEAYEGDVETAIETFGSMASPDLVVVQTDEINDEFADRLEALASNCKEDTAAIVIGPVNDVYLYRKLIGMGVSDYLVRPIKAKVFAEVIAKTLIDRIGAIGSHLIVVAGAKGGVGTTTFAQLLAWGAAEELEEKTVLLDAAGGWSASGVALGFDPSTTLPEALRAAEAGSEDNLKRMLVRPTERLSVLATGGDVMLDHNPAPEKVEILVDLLMTKYPVVILDLSQAPAPIFRTMAAKAHRVILVSQPVLTSLRLARTLLMEVEELRGGEKDGLRLVVNMQGISPSGEVAKTDIEAALERKPDLFMPFNPKLFVGAESQGKKFFEGKQTVDSVHGAVSLIRDLLAAKEEGQDAAAKQGKVGGLLGMFSRKG